MKNILYLGKLKNDIPDYLEAGRCIYTKIPSSNDFNSLHFYFTNHIRNAELKSVRDINYDDMIGCNLPQSLFEKIKKISASLDVNGIERFALAEKKERIFNQNKDKIDDLAIQLASYQMSPTEAQARKIEKEFIQQKFDLPAGDAEFVIRNAPYYFWDNSIVDKVFDNYKEVGEYLIECEDNNCLHDSLKKFFNYEEFGRSVVVNPTKWFDYEKSPTADTNVKPFLFLPESHKIIKYSSCWLNSRYWLDTDN